MNNIQIILNDFKSLQIALIYSKSFQIYEYIFIKILYYLTTQYARMVYGLLYLVGK